MKGSNQLVLNQATMIEAIQFWLDSQMVNQAPKVVRVSGPNTNSCESDFTIFIDADADRNGSTKPRA